MCDENNNTRVVCPMCEHEFWVHQEVSNEVPDEEVLIELLKMSAKLCHQVSEKARKKYYDRIGVPFKSRACFLDVA